MAQGPVTPPRNIKDRDQYGSCPPAPCRTTRGCVDLDGNVDSPGVSPREGREKAAESRDTTNLDFNNLDPNNRGDVVRVVSAVLSPNGNLGPAPAWNGPAAVSGHLNQPNDPFVVCQTNPEAPAFVPASNLQLGPGGSSGDSSSHGAGHTNGSTSNGNATNGSNTKSNGSSGGMSTSRGNSANSNGQGSDSFEPVIVTTPHVGHKGKGKQAVRPMNPDNATRFVRVDGVFAVDFEDGKPFGYIKGQSIFKEDVQKLGTFALKPAGASAQTVYMFVDTLSTAREIHRLLRHAGYTASYISLKDFKAVGVQVGDNVERFSAEISFTATMKDHSRARRFTVEAVTEMAKSAAAKFGKIISFDLVENNYSLSTGGSLRFRLEYDSVGNANDAVHVTNPMANLTYPFGTHEHIYIRALGYDPVNPSGSTSPNSDEPNTSPSRKNGSGSNEVLDYSPTGRTATRTTVNGKTAVVTGYVVPGKMAGPSNHAQVPYQHGQPTGQFARNIYQTHDPTAEVTVIEFDGHLHPGLAKPQDVVEWRILNGFDVRTTLMVRNVPPEMTGQDFVDMLNQTVPGEFDFAYNRIDFQKSQSVGYAFVNFTDTKALLRFVNTWKGKLLPHNLHRQHLRPCAVSYANTQGYECLVAKFRNSSILDEAKPCRPILFWTAASAGDRTDLIGQEREWPEVDNASKKGRSVENAKISGLYIPRKHANGGRGGRRGGGHTRYDRGTTAQQQDENHYAYNNYQHGVSQAPAYDAYAQPRFQPAPMLYNWNSNQYVPQVGMPYHNTQYQMPPMMQGQAVPAQGSALRTHTHGDLGYRHPVMPAELASVNHPNQSQTAHQDQFQPLLYPLKGQVPEYYRSV